MTTLTFDFTGDSDTKEECPPSTKPSPSSTDEVVPSTTLATMQPSTKIMSTSAPCSSSLHLGDIQLLTIIFACRHALVKTI